MRNFYTHTTKNIWKVASPIIVSGLADNLNHAINTLFVGRLGGTAIGAVGLGGLFYFNFLVIAMGLAIGAQIIIGTRNGEKNYIEAGSTFNHALVLFGGISLLLLGFVYAFAHQIFPHLIQDKELLGKVEGYFNIRILGLIPMFLVSCFRAFFIGITYTRVITVITLITALTNIFLDYSLIFGNFGFPKVGINGAAIASVIAECVALLGFILFTRYKKSLSNFKLFNLKAVKRKVMLKIFSVGSPMMLQSWASFSSWMLFFLFIEKIGKEALAVSTILKTVYLLYLIPIHGFGSAVNTITSNLIGAKKAKFVEATASTGAIFASLVIFLPVLGAFILPRELLTLFTNDVAIQELGINPLRVLCLALMLFPLAVVYFNAVSGSGDTRAAMLIEIITIVCYVGYIFLSAFYMQWSITYIWMAEIVYMAILGIGSYYRLSSGKWQKSRV